MSPHGPTERDRIYGTLLEWLKAQGVPADATVTEDTHLRDDLGIDSLDATEMMLHFEEVMNVRVPDEDERLFQGHVRDLLDYLEARS